MGERGAQRGRFVVLEGIDGAGKTEQVGRLARWLESRGVEVVATREPTDGPHGRRYRAWARGEFEATPDEVLQLFVRDREQHLAEVIEPALARGAFVVCDRYVASTRAYQAAAGVDRELLRRALAHFREPELVLWLRLPVPVALERMGDDATERFETGAFLERVDAEYARFELLEIDATGTPDAVEARLRAHVQPLLDDAATRARYFEPEPGSEFDPRALLEGCVESGAEGLLLDAPALAPEFFDLRTGVAGELLHQLGKYRIRLAAVVPDPARHSARFQAFMRESNRGRQARFFEDRAAALTWLDGERP